jgi:hypothetical protein
VPKSAKRADIQITTLAVKSKHSAREGQTQGQRQEYVQREAAMLGP